MIMVKVWESIKHHVVQGMLLPPHTNLTLLDIRADLIYLRTPVKLGFSVRSLLIASANDMQCFVSSILPGCRGNALLSLLLENRAPPPPANNEYCDDLASVLSRRIYADRAECVPRRHACRASASKTVILPILHNFHYPRATNYPRP